MPLWCPLAGLQASGGYVQLYLLPVGRACQLPGQAVIRQRPRLTHLHINTPTTVISPGQRAQHQPSTQHPPLHHSKAHTHAP